MILCIDASNIRAGGGLTHLVELLSAADPRAHGFNRVIVWAGMATLAKINDRDWLTKVNDPLLERGWPYRVFWQRFRLKKLAQQAECDVLFVPGGSYAGSFKPVVTMSQNLLPFEMQELRRYGGSLTTLRLTLLRRSQSRSFRHADGVIFLTQYAHDSVLTITGALQGQTLIIPHGLNTRFQMKRRIQRAIAEYNIANPYRLLYVSIIDHYKHQWHVVEAVAALRLEGVPVTLDLIGPAYPPALERLETSMNRWDPHRSWVNYHGPIPYEDLHLKYAEADLGIFASSCENMPNILLETMAAGLPVACSNRGPMPEVLGDAGVYFDPEQPLDIARALRELINSPQLRTEMAKASYERSLQYSWQRCAKDTFFFLGQAALRYKAFTCAAS